MTITLKAADYDAFRSAIDRFGGIGAGEQKDAEGKPVCAQGFADVIEHHAFYNRLHAAGMTARKNDAAVWRINDRKAFSRFRNPNARVSSSEYFAELQIERGGQ